MLPALSLTGWQRDAPTHHVLHSTQVYRRQHLGWHKSRKLVGMEACTTATVCTLVVSAGGSDCKCTHPCASTASSPKKLFGICLTLD